MNTYNLNQFILKKSLIFFGLALIVLFVSCAPTIHYIGDSYQATSNVDVYYDEKDVEKEYRTIGKMSHGNMMDFEMETIKNKMIERAKTQGADGIIFMDVKNVIDTHDHEDVFLDNDRLSVTANLIKYKN